MLLLVHERSDAFLARFRADDDRPVFQHGRGRERPAGMSSRFSTWPAPCRSSRTAVAFTVIVDRVIGLLALLLFGVLLSLHEASAAVFPAGETRRLPRPRARFYLLRHCRGSRRRPGQSWTLFPEPSLFCFGWARSFRWPSGARSSSPPMNAPRARFGTNLRGAGGVSIPSHMSIMLMGYCILQRDETCPRST